MKSSVLKLVIVFLLLVPTASAAWTIEDVESPYSLDNVDLNTDTVQIIRVLDDNNDPVDESKLGSTNWELGLYYNMTDWDDPYKMRYMGDGYWYKKFNATADDDYLVKYALEEDTPSGDEITENETVNDGNLGVNIVTNIQERYKAEDEIFIEANVTDETTGSAADNSNTEVTAYFTDGKNVYSKTELGWRNNSRLYGNSVSVPPKYNQTFALHVEATSSGVSNGYGSKSDIIDTYPAKLGHFEYMDASGSGCNNASFFSACERGTNIDLGFNATVFPADSAKFEVFLERKEGFQEQVREINMNKENGLWTASFEFPDVNTSVYNNKVAMRVNASIDNSYYYLNRNITSRSLKIRDSSDPTTYPGQNYPVELAFVKYFSLEPLNETRIKDASAKFKYPNGTVLEELTLSDFNYSSAEGLFQSEVEIPADAEEGNYPVDIEATNIHGETKQSRSGFNVKDVQVSFEALDDISIEVSKSGTYTEEVVLESKVGDSRTLDWRLGGEIENITTVNNGDPVELPASQAKEVPVEFNLDTLESYEGNITFSDSTASYNDTVDVTIDIPECKLRDGDLCLLEGEWLNMTGLEVGHEVINVTILNFGQEQKEVDVFMEGNISQYLNVEPINFQLEESEQVTFNYSVEDKGDFTGVVGFTTSADTIRLNTKLTSKANRKDASIKTPESLDIGTVASGETISKQIFIHNNGDLSVESLSVSSDYFEPYISSRSLTVGQNETFTLELRKVDSGYGSVTISGETSRGTVTSTISISGSVETRKDVSDLRSRINSLRTQVESTSDERRLNSLETRVSNIESLYESGDYETANNRYREVSSELNDLESKLSGSNTDPRQGQQDPNGQTGQENSSMQGLLVPVAVVLFVIILVGFVFYTSYVPEEGDPLYDLMGE